MTRISRHAPSIEAIAATVTALVAVAALVGVTVQLDTAERIQKEQSAREAYRAHLALAASMPQFARPVDVCALMASRDGGAYIAFLDHLLYSAEQMLAVAQGWETTFVDQISPHSDYFCSAERPVGDTDETALLLSRFQQSSCPAEPTCQ